MNNSDMNNIDTQLKIHDMHTHFKSGRYSTPSDLQQFLRGMEQVGIDKSLILPYDGLYSHCKQDNDLMATTVKAAPSRLWGMGVVNPRDEDCCEEMERCLCMGLIGIKLHPWLQAFSPFDPKYIQLAQHAAYLNTVLFFHDGTPPYTQPLAIAETARMFPRITIVLGHSGLNDLWQEALISLKKYDNVWLCTCGCPYYALQQIAQATNGERVMFGTDYPLATVKDVEDRINRIKHLKVSDDIKQKIFSENAEKFTQMFRPAHKNSVLSPDGGRRG